jgi:hypothetical protein
MNSKMGITWYTHWFYGMHDFWLSLNSIAFFYLLIKALSKRDGKSIFLFFLFAVPLSYYLSYLLGTPAPDYRYMYPSTLVMQAIVVSLVLTKILGSYRKTPMDENVV